MAGQKNKTKKRTPPAVWRIVNAFSAFLYSIFVNGRVGDMLSSNNGLYEGSLCEGFLEKSAKEKRYENYAGSIVEKSVALSALTALRAFMASLALNVYAIFFVVYGLTSVFIYYLTIALNGKNDHGTSTLITAVIIVLCAIPALVSSRPVAEMISESRVISWISRQLLGIPKEKMRANRCLSGSEFMFMASIIAILFGIFSYFLHSSYMPVIFGIVVAVCIISSNPESGVVMTVAAAPFLQYSRAAELILVVMIVVTAISYIGKLAKRQRTISLSGESILTFIFCGFVLVASIFSHGGAVTFREGLTSVAVILGGFFLTYNLVRGEKRLNTCIIILTVSFIALGLAGLWNMFYNGIADGVMYSIREDVRPIFENNIIYIADSAEVFGVLAVLVSPLVFSCAAKCRSAKSFAVIIIMMLVTFASTFIYGSYEALIAIAVEFFLFWLIYSHKSLSVIILAAIPVGICALLFPYISAWLGIESMGEILEGILPLGFADGDAYIAAVNSTLEMLNDGNLMGIGAGKHAFDSAYPAYATVVSEGVSSPASFWLQVICWSGVGGFIAFVMLMLVLLKNSIGAMIVSREKDLRTEAVALFCGVFTALIFGSVNCLWSDLRMLYLVWTMIGLLSAYVREIRGREERKLTVFESASDAIDVEMRFHD